MRGNKLTTLPASVFSGLKALQQLWVCSVLRRCCCNDFYDRSMCVLDSRSFVSLYSFLLLWYVIMNVGIFLSTPSLPFLSASFPVRSISSRMHPRLRDSAKKLSFICHLVPNPLISFPCNVLLESAHICSNLLGNPLQTAPSYTAVKSTIAETSIFMFVQQSSTVERFLSHPPFPHNLATSYISMDIQNGFQVVTFGLFYFLFLI